MDGVPRINVVLRCFLPKKVLHGSPKVWRRMPICTDYEMSSLECSIMRCRLLNVVQEFVNNREVTDQLSC